MDGVITNGRPAGPAQLVDWVSPVATRGSSGACLVQAEERLEADGQARVDGDPADAGQHPGHERHPVETVVTDRQRLTRPAEQDLLMGDQSPQPDRVHGDAVQVGATGTDDRLAGGIGLVEDEGESVIVMEIVP